VPLLAGVFDFCIFAPLFGAPFSGKAIRKSWQCTSDVYWP
jgi:hypothetical protein